MREFKCNRFFVQQDEFNLSELISEGISFATIQEARDWVKRNDPNDEFAYNIYKIDAEIVESA